MDNVIDALEQSNCVSQVDLHLERWQIEEVLAAMQVPFPKLTDLRFLSDSKTPFISDSFLGGSSLCLRSLTLENFLFPGLPKLLLTATHLVDLYLLDIPDFGYISPEAMINCLSVMTSLGNLFLGFSSSESRPRPDKEI